MGRRILGILAATLAVAMPIGSSVAASARGQARDVGLRGPSHAASPASAPPGYTVMTSDLIEATAGTRTHGEADCPAGKVVVGGGVFIAQGAAAMTLNSSWPTSNAGWGAEVNNAGENPTAFKVQAMCVPNFHGYKVVSKTLANPVGAQTTVKAACGKKFRVLGGGGLSNVSDTAANLSSTFPYGDSDRTTGKGWQVRMNNASASAGTETAYAICTRGKGDSVGAPETFVGQPITSSPNSTASAGSICPALGVPLSAGVAASGGSILVSIRDSYLYSTSQWVSEVTNGSTGTPSIKPYMICGWG